MWHSLSISDSAMPCAYRSALALDCNMLATIVTFDSVYMQWVQRWVHRAGGAAPFLPAAHLPHLPQLDAMTCPDSSPDAQAPRAMSPEAEADMAVDDIMHGQISLSAFDSAANAPPASLLCELPASHALALGVAALAAAKSLLGDSSSAAAISASEPSGVPGADALSPANIAKTRLAAASGHCKGYKQAELEGSDELCKAVNLPGISTFGFCMFSFRSMPCSVCMPVVHTMHIVTLPVGIKASIMTAAAVGVAILMQYSVSLV